MFPAYCLERASRPWHREAEAGHSPGDSMSGDGAESMRNPRRLEFAEQNNGEEIVS